MSHARIAMLLLAAACALPASARAQKTQLTVSGYPISFTAPTAADFTAGSITSASALLYTVNAQNGTTGQRTTTVSIRCAVPCPATGTKPVSSLSWRRADLSNWVPRTTSDAVIETQLVFRNGANDPWSNSLYFQFALGWTADPPNATAHTYNLVLTLTVTVP